MAQIKMREAEKLLEAAEHSLADDDEVSPSLAIVHATESLILALDAICHRVNFVHPTRHDQGHQVFRSLLTDGKVPASGARFREFLRRANAQRADFHYHGELTSKANARRFVREATEFVAFARETVGP